MLVLTRKPDESITIRCPDGTFITISVCRIDPNYKVRLGLDAPKDFKITRTELIEKANVSAEEFFSKFAG
jgi:carbon storage regulator CsrA